jgi:hypothetical protein
MVNYVTPQAAVTKIAPFSGEIGRQPHRRSTMLRIAMRFFEMDGGVVTLRVWAALALPTALVAKVGEDCLESGENCAFWLPPRDSNPDMLLQRQLSYH